ncbi:AAA family ATPase, partial [Sulfurovum sp. bin170]|uniref:AAA family ATPase n=1 Tax=Sulfurovum sp. bin170 TaxID=2695268 RepID=UPI0013DFAA2C
DRNFSNYCNIRIEHFLKKYSFDIEIDRDKATHENLNFVFSKLRLKKIPIYVMIDDYDKFNIENKIICKDFFRALRTATSDNNSSLKKIFTIGTLPTITLDITNGGAISTNISNLQTFNNVLGITRDELDKFLYYYSNSLFEIQNSKLNIDNCYDGYKFNENMSSTLYNTDMILYYVNSLILDDEPPANLVDINIRTDYSKLRYLVYTNNRLNGNFNTLQRLLGGDEVTTLQIKDSFSAFDMKQEDNFILLLYYLGLITIDKFYRGEYYFKIPNQTIRIIMAEEIVYCEQYL